MKRKIVITLIILALSTGLIFMIPKTGVVEGQAVENVPIFESVPDEVVIYQGNMALVKDTLDIYSGKDVKVVLPPQAVADSIEIIDGGVKISKFSIGASGDAAGHYQRNSSVKNLLAWKSNKTGSRKIVLNYMMKGLSWRPNYVCKILSDSSVAFQYRVGIHNGSPASTTAKMKLVSGEIGSPSTGSGVYYRQMNNAQFKVSAYNRSQVDSSIPSIGATKISAHYVYEKLPQVPLKSNGTTYLTLTDKKLDAQKEYVWLTTAGEKVDIVYSIKNSTGEPFAEGLVNVFKEGIFLGSDIIEWTPSGGKGHVTVGSAIDIQAEKTVDIEYIKSRGHTKEYKHTMKLTLKNYSKTPKTVKVFEQKYPDSVDAQFQLKPESAGNNTYVWKLAIPAGGSKEVTYSFYSDSQYRKAYQSYN